MCPSLPNGCIRNDTLARILKIPEQPAPAAEPEPVAAAAATMGNGAPAFLMPGQNDTASLLRELSSLGLDDDAPQAPRPSRPAPRSAPPGADSKDKGKKKKGLFGR